MGAATVAMNGTPDQCGCSKLSRFNNGPGCYLAYANAYDAGMKFKGGAAPADPPAGPAADSGVRGAVFVSIRVSADHGNDGLKFIERRAVIGAAAEMYRRS